MSLQGHPPLRALLGLSVSPHLWLIFSSCLCVHPSAPSSSPGEPPGAVFFPLGIKLFPSRSFGVPALKVWITRCVDAGSCPMSLPVPYPSGLVARPPLCPHAAQSGREVIGRQTPAHLGCLADQSSAQNKPSGSSPVPPRRPRPQAGIQSRLHIPSCLFWSCPTKLHLSYLRAVSCVSSVGVSSAGLLSFSIRAQLLLQGLVPPPPSPQEDHG